MESPIDRLVEIVFELDGPESRGVIRLRSGEAVVRIQVLAGGLQDSFLEGPGQTFTDFLMEAGTVTREDYDGSLRIAQEADLTIFQALERMGAVAEDELRMARQQLSADRFRRAILEGLDEVELEPWETDLKPPELVELRIAALFVEVLHSQHQQGLIAPITPPPYAVIRPTERLGSYIDVLRSRFGTLPLPRVGGERYEVLIERHGADAAVPLSVMLRTGMIKTEFGAGGSVVPEGPLHLAGLASLLKHEARILMGGMGGGEAGGSRTRVVLGDLWRERFGALWEAWSCYREAGAAGGDVTDRLLPLELIGPLAGEPHPTPSVEAIAKLGGERGNPAGMLRVLVCRHVAHGALEEAMMAVREAFRQEPDSEPTLSLFVQLFERHASAIRDLSGVDPVEFILEAVRAAREVGKPDLASHLLSRGGAMMDGSADLLAQAMDLYRERGWSPDLIEVVVDFACDAGRKGWTNPLWSLGGHITRAEESLPLRLVIDIYEVLVKASPNRREALDKLVRMVEGIGQPNLLLDMLERSLEVLSADEDLESIYSRLARLYLDQFGDLKEASRYASHCLVRRPENPETVQLVLKAAKAGKLSRSSGYRFAKAMSRLSTIPTPEKLEWLVRAARIAEKDLKDLPLALALMKRIHEEYGRDAGGHDMKQNISRLEGTISGLTGERLALREGLAVDEMREDEGRLLEEAEALKRLARISLQFEDGSDEACGLLEALLGARVFDWDAVELALVKVDDVSMRRRLIEKVAVALDEGAEHHPPLPLLEEMAEAWREVGRGHEREQSLLDGVHRAILAVSPFHRESVRHLGLRASSAGDVDRIIQFTERRIATARPQERGNLYVELASYGDLIEEYESRAPTFWRIGSNAMPAHPSVLANDFLELCDNGQWSESAAWLETNLPRFPRSHRPRIYSMMRQLSDRAGDRSGAMHTALRAMRHTPWNMDLAFEVFRRAEEADSGEGFAEALENLLTWHYLDPGMISTLERGVSKLVDREDDGGALERCARLLCELPLPGTPRLVGLLEQVAGVLAGRGDTEPAAACLERALLATSDPEVRVDITLRIADVFDSAGEEALERLLVVLLRARRAGVEDDVVIPWAERALDRSGLEWRNRDVLRTLFAGNIGPDEVEWVDVLVAMFMSLVLGEREEAQRVLDEAEQGGAGRTVKLAAAALHDLEGMEGDTVEALVGAASMAGDPVEAAKMWVRVSRIHEEAGDPERAADAAISALELCPDNGDMLALAETIALGLKDAGRLIRIYDLAQENLPGRKSEQAFHYRFAKSFEDLFGDRPGAMDMYLMSLSIQPKAGAALEAVERLSHTMQKHDGLVRAADMLRREGRDRRTVGAFIARNAEQFLEEENLASAYHLVLDAVIGDPGLDLLSEVKLMAGRSQAGKSSAQKIVHRWVPLLEQAILESGEDTDLPRRLDAVAELKHLLAEGPVGEASGAEPAKKRHSIPPEADAAWDALGPGGEADGSEITLEQVPTEVEPETAGEEESGMSPLEEELEDSKVTLMPKPREGTAEEIPPSQPPPAPVSAEEPAVSGPPAVVAVEEVAPSESPTERAQAEEDRIRSPRPRVGGRKRKKMFEITSPLPVVKVGPSQSEEPAGMAEPEEEIQPGATSSRERSSPVVDEIGMREEVEPKVIVRDDAESRVIMRAKTSPPPKTALEDLGELVGRPREDDDYSVEVMLGDDGSDFPVQLTDEEASSAGLEESAAASQVGAGPLERLVQEPWDLELARGLLDEPVGRRSGVKAMVGSLLSLTDEDPRSASSTRPVFKDSRSTLDGFKRLLRDEPRYRLLRILGIVWDAAARLFKESIGDYGMKTADQITPFSIGPVAPVLEKAIRSLGYVRMAVYYRRERRYELRVVRTTPPSVAVFLPLGRLPVSLEFYLARCFWAVNPRRILAYSLPHVDGQRMVEAVLEAFGSATGRGGKVGPEVSSMTQDLWRMVPARSQETLRSMLVDVDAIDFEGLQVATKRECTRAGILFSADLASGVRHVLPENVGSTPTGSFDRDVLAKAIRSSAEVQDLIRFFLSGEVLEFLDTVLG